MKKYLSIIIAAFMTASAAAQYAELNSPPQKSNVPETNTTISATKPEETPDNILNPKDCEKVKALQFDDYRHMTISEFQSKVWTMTDTPEYCELLDRLCKDEDLYALRDSDETAWFLFYVLEPLTGENWRTQTYNGAAVSNFPFPADNATLEYTYTITILNSNRVMVKDYCDIVSNVKDAFCLILWNRTEEELQNEEFMLKEIDAFVKDILPDMQTPEISVEIEYAYFPLSSDEDWQPLPSYEISEGELESGYYTYGTAEDYNSLLALKTPDYEKMPLAGFNSTLLEWANENYYRMERINEDIAWGDFRVTLTGEELSFVELTVFLSGMENGARIKNDYTGKKENPVYDEYLPTKAIKGKENVAWCDLYYQFSYEILDETTVTLGERDSRIGGMIKAVRKFWEDTDIETLLKMSEDDITNELQRLAAEYSTNNIKISTCEKQIHFEHMDERYIN